MPYLIDGHNLIGQLPDISLDDPNDEARLVQKLAGYMARTNKRCTVVFDSGLPGGRSRMSNRTVEVVFAARPSDADRLILRRIQRTTDPRNWTVISSDNDVLNAARLKGMQIIKSADFAKMMMTPIRPPRQKQYGGKNEHDPYVSPAEVDYWLKIFGDGPAQHPKRAKKVKKAK